MSIVTSRTKSAFAYAKTFLNVHSEPKCDQLTWINTLHRHYYTYEFFFKLLELSSLSHETKKRYIKEFWKKFQLPESLENFMYLLLRKRAMNLLPDILKELYREYKKRSNLLDITITTSHPLSQEETHNLLKAIQESLNLIIIPHFKVDSTLIAGIRIESVEYYWEQSVARTLRSLEQTLRS